MRKIGVTARDVDLTPFVFQVSPHAIFYAVTLFICENALERHLFEVSPHVTAHFSLFLLPRAEKFLKKFM
ncbi:MAG: hypothetical protein IJ685_00160 [Selenomonadaceae bacterium]|nr:hypothetical protein [Selenomonadaceae bacterium]